MEILSRQFEYYIMVEKKWAVVNTPAQQEISLSNNVGFALCKV